MAHFRRAIFVLFTTPLNLHLIITRSLYVLCLSILSFHSTLLKVLNVPDITGHEEDRQSNNPDLCTNLGSNFESEDEDTLCVDAVTSRSISQPPRCPNHQE